MGTGASGRAALVCRGHANGHGEPCPLGAFGTSAECREVVKRSYTSLGAPADAVARLIEYPERSWVGKRTDGGDMIVRYVCHPDSVDPRGPKGGK